MPVVGRNLHAGADSMWRRSNTTTRPDALDIQLRRRLTFTLLTPVLQIVSAVALAAAFASVTEDDLSGWGDLIGLLVALVLGPGLGLALMLGIVSRRVGHSLIGSILRGSIAMRPVEACRRRW